MKPRALALVQGLVVLLFVINFIPLVTQRYPREIALDAVQKLGADNIRLETTVLHSDESTVSIFLPVAADEPKNPVAGRRYVLVNAKDIWVPGGADEVHAPPRGQVIFSTRHPRQLRSMQYHGYLPAERAFLRSVDLSIKLIDTQGIH